MSEKPLLDLWWPLAPFFDIVGKSKLNMKDIMLLIGVFALGYVVTMGLVFALLKVFFPFQSADQVALDTPNNILKVNRTSATRERVGTRVRKVRLANG